ncbi:trichohyalin-like isoform X1 [Brienomyrus brachyistius]|uniref:trichohyalin-like isoform X1 n=1 Tax=Brienomyrus brachyistius TaxID=42636 RepID=UPI0020B433DD|nr:trichohyalin-like isoform X1 [Brienomyrus brachyistius]XP_048867539.1 trichohyalin-like isoform X1 [Brienomyrus brachyistius]XP_048867540.1 trichohyalin-like isoform X1 [Brienomyrus brachyistius]
MESQDYAAGFVDQHRAELIERVRAVDPIGRGLLPHRTMHTRLTMLLNDTSQNIMKNIYQDLDLGGAPAKEAFYKLLKEHEPQLIQELETEKVSGEIQSHGEEPQHLKEEREKERQELEAWRAARETEERRLHQMRCELQREREEVERIRDTIQKEKETMNLKKRKQRVKHQIKEENETRKLTSERPSKIGVALKSLLRKCQSMDQILKFASVPELRLVVLGRSTARKSLIANAILRREVFVSGTPSPTQVQMSSERKIRIIAGRQVVVVNTPDWFSSTVSQFELWQDVKHCMELSAPGPHAFLLVTEMHEYGEVQATILEKMREILGNDCFPHTIVLLTHASELTESITGSFVHTGSSDLQRKMTRCGNRYHIINTSNWPESYQISWLLESIAKMVEENQWSFYSSKMHKEVMSQIQEMEQKFQRERAERKLREELEAKKKFEKELQDSLRERETVIQVQKKKIVVLEEKIVELEEQLKEERDEEKKKELEEELNKEVELRNVMQNEVKQFKEEAEKEKSEREEKHRQEIEEIREDYEEKAEAERYVMKILLPEMFSRLQSTLKTKNNEYERQIEEKHHEIAVIKEEMQKLKTEMNREMEEMKRVIARVQVNLESSPQLEGTAV